MIVSEIVEVEKIEEVEALNPVRWAIIEVLPDKLKILISKYKMPVVGVEPTRGLTPTGF